MEIFLEDEFSDAIEKLKDNPRQTKEIINLLLHSIKTGTFVQILNVENRIHELANSNPYFSQDYVRKYVELFKDDWFLFSEPYRVHYFLPDNIGPIIPVVGEIDHSGTPERIIKVQFFRALIQKYNANYRNLCDMQQIAERLALIAETTPFVINPFTHSDLSNFDSLVDKSIKLIDDIEENANFQVHSFQICEELKKFPILRGYIETFLAGCIRDEHYSPLLLFLKENTDLNDAYLSELERGIALYESLPNEKNSTLNRIKREIKKQLENNEDFGDFLSELLIMNKLGKGRIVVKDKKIGEKHIDLEIKLAQKKILLEIRAPKMQRDSTIARAGFLRNKFDDAIIDKRRQLKEGLRLDTNPSIIADNLIYYVVIDGSKTPVAQDCMDLFVNENQENDLVSGVIVFRPLLGVAKSHHLALSGWIKNNPKGKNVLSTGELKNMYKILFE